MCFDQEKTQAPGTENRLRQAEAGLAGGQIARPLSDEDIVAEFFKYHPPTDVTLPKFAAINQAAKNFAEVILSTCPRGADRSVAIRLLRDARMTANAAIALNGLSL